MVESSIQIGEFICVKNPETQKLSFGKVTQIKGPIVHFLVYCKPQDLSGHKLMPYHSKFELICTDENSKEFISNVVNKIQILRLQDYKEKFPTLQTAESPSNIVYFFRQKVVRVKDQPPDVFKVVPELKPICVCQQILKVDDESEECPSCKDYFHPICMRQHSDRRCFKCKEELPKKLVYTHKREDQQEAQASESQKRQKLDGDHFQTLTSKLVPKDPYPSLVNPILKKKLDSFVTVLKKANEFQLGTEVSQETQQLQTRKNVKENFTYCLLLGVAEAIQAQDIPKNIAEAVQNKDWQEDTFWDAARKVCQGIAAQIESGMCVHLNTSGKEITREYGRKFRQLQTSLRNDQNAELRSQLLKESINAIELTQMTPDQLAPKSKQEQIEESKKFFFEQRVLPKDEGMVIMKTSAGLEIIQPYEVKTVVEMDDPVVVESQKEEVQVNQQASYLPKETQELFNDLDKWSFPNLKAKFIERISNHLKANKVSREQMLVELDKLDVMFTQ